VNHFWPSRPYAEGFSIEKLAKKYREKISTFKSAENHPKKESYYSSQNVQSIKEKVETFQSYSFNCVHWANRCFEEYLY
tara:strand:- start:118 stop:354 length:237 start_codon:yes stop_codon:yes gene_type:complete